MLDYLLSFLAPHQCISCRKTGFLLCDECRAELLCRRITLCIGCGKPADGICVNCHKSWPVERAVLFGNRDGILKEAINQFKFAYKRSAALELAGLIGILLPYGAKAAIVPIPTITKHIRERGYDHMALLAKSVVKQNRLIYAPLLLRRGSTVQHGASKINRVKQVERAFFTKTVLDPNLTYIIFDDITTTGASLKAASVVLRAAGARHIWVVALARQPLEETLDERG